MTPASSARMVARSFVRQELTESAAGLTSTEKTSHVAAVADTGGVPNDERPVPDVVLPSTALVADPDSGSILGPDGYPIPQPGHVPNPGQRTGPTQPVQPNPPPAQPNPQPAQPNPQSGQNQQPATTNPGTGKPVDDKTQTGPLPGQPIAPPAEPAAPRVEGVPQTVPTQNGGTLTSTIVAGTGGQTVDSETEDGHGNITRSRAVMNDQGGVTIWTAHADGKHSVTYVAGPGQEKPWTTETYTYDSASATSLAKGPNEYIEGDGNGNWLKQSQNADGSPSVKMIQKQTDGVTVYETERLPGGGTRTYASRPGDPEYSTPWLVGETKPDGSGTLTRIDGSTKETRPDGSGTISGGIDGTTTNFGTDKWGQKFVQTYDPANDQIVTRVTKDANTDKPWEEIITSDLKGGFEGHYREGVGGERELIWQMLADGYKLTPNGLGGRNVEKNGVVEGVFTSEQDGTLRFKPNKAYKDRTGAELTQEIVMVPGQGPKTLWGNGRDGDKRIDFRPLNTQHGEVPGMPWVGSEKGPIGQDYDSFAAKFGMAIINTYDGILPLIGQGGSSNQGFKEAWTALGKNVAKTAAIAALTAQGGPGGYELANSGAIPGLNKGEANQIVKDLANSLGYSDFKEGRIGAGMGTLLGGLAAGSALGKLGGFVTRPLAAGARGVIGAALRDGTSGPTGMPGRGLPEFPESGHFPNRNEGSPAQGTPSSQPADRTPIPSRRGPAEANSGTPARPSNTGPTSKIGALIEAEFRLWGETFRDFGQALRTAIEGPGLATAGVPSRFFDGRARNPGAAANRFDSSATGGGSPQRNPNNSPPAGFGSSTSTDYRGTFFAANPHLNPNDYVVHHAVEQQVLTRFPGVVTPSEIHSLENLRGIPRGIINSRVHLSRIRKEWNAFYKPFVASGTKPTKQQLLDFATQVDRKYGFIFNPPLW
ncbi:hypothetical protein [Nocardia sp. NPDC049149]|uniref:hypothetical protein n=1 Tax=Nocardia sp. NPDC049149 TaxID=3364315 RepID=UPI00371A8572